MGVGVGGWVCARFGRKGLPTERREGELKSNVEDKTRTKIQECFPFSMRADIISNLGESIPIVGIEQWVYIDSQEDFPGSAWKITVYDYHHTLCDEVIFD